MRTIVMALFFVICLQSAEPEKTGSTANPLASPAASRQDTLPKVWALIIGVSKYKDSSLNLQFAAKNAMAYAEFLKSPGGGSVPEKQIVLLTDQQATAEQIHQALDSLETASENNGKLMIYISCRETAIKNELYFVTYEATLESPTLQYHDFLPPGERMLIIDAIYSGSKKYAPTKFSPRFRGPAIFRAAAIGELTKEDTQLGYGVFTWYWLQGMRSKELANPNTGMVHLYSLFEYTRKQVEKHSNNKQHPDFSGSFSPEQPMSIVK